MLEPCFWSQFQPNPSIFCEQPLCGMIVEPSNTWSNIGYLIAAILIYKSTKVTNKRVKHFFALATLFLFVGSTLFHASGTYMGRMVDVSTMFLVSSVILTLSCERFFKLRERNANILFLSLITISLISLFYFHTGSVFFAAQILAATILEYRLAQTPTGLNMQKVGLAVATIVTAFIFWILDVKKIFCIPDNHILTGHALWHLLAAASIWFFFLAWENYKESYKRPSD